MFNPRTELDTNPPHSFEKWGDLSFVPNNRKMGQKYDQSYRNNWTTHGGGVQFRLETMEEADSGVCSPPLWGNSTPPQPQNPAQPRQNSSRKQAIAKGQFELMEMVKNMPESCYELSLKDIVEHKYQTGLGADDQEDYSLNSNEENSILGAKNKRVNEKNKVLRSRSNDDQNRGMLLKMGFVPFFSFNGSNNKKKKGCVRNIGKNNNTCAKVSPKPESSPKNVERDWWRKRMAVSGESSGGDSSHGGSTTGSSGSSESSRSTSSTSSRRNTGDRRSGCWPIFRSMKNKGTR